MDKKLFFLFLFLLFNVLTYVYAQNNPADDDSRISNAIDLDRDITNSITTLAPPTPSQDPPTPSPPTPSPDPPTPSPSTPSQDLPTPSPPTSQDPPTPSPPTPSQDPTPPPIIITTSKTPSTPIPDEGVKITQTPLDDSGLIMKPQNTTTPPVTQQIQKTTTVQQSKPSAAAAKSYPQTTFVFYDDNTEDTPLEYLSLLYIMSGLVSTLLVIFATYTIYKKGLGEETNNKNNNNNNWENEIEDDGYRNRSTISRGTLTPSVRNTTLGSPTSNPSYKSNPSNPTLPNNSNYQ